MLASILTLVYTPSLKAFQSYVYQVLKNQFSTHSGEMSYWILHIDKISADLQNIYSTRANISLIVASDL